MVKECSKNHWEKKVCELGKDGGRENRKWRAKSRERKVLSRRRRKGGGKEGDKKVGEQ